MPRKSQKPTQDAQHVAAHSAARNTDSGPAHIPPEAAAGDAPARKAAGAQALAASMPHNTLKPLEHGTGNGLAPNAGLSSEPEHPDVTGSTLSEQHPTPKSGMGATPG